VAFALSQIAEKLELEIVTDEEFLINSPITHCEAWPVNRQDLASD